MRSLPGSILAAALALASCRTAPVAPGPVGAASGPVVLRGTVLRPDGTAVPDAGVLVVAGSDAGNIGTFHGPAVLREVELLVQAGLSPARALRAATLDAARALGRERDLGSVEAGKLADLVVLDASPLEDVRNLARVHAVVKGGVARAPGEILPPSAEEEAQRRVNAEKVGD